MEIIFLGTSSGTPTKTRNVSGLAIKMASSKPWCLVDCGEGTQHQILKTNLTLNNLSAIFITHLHGDHCYGLQGLLASATMLGRKSDLTIVGPRDTQDYFENIQKHSQMRLSYKIKFVAVEDIDCYKELTDFNVEIINLSHRVQSYGYGFSEKNISAKLDIEKLKRDKVQAGSQWGILQNGKDVVLKDGTILKSKKYLLEKRKARKIIVSGDNDKPELYNKAVKTAHVLVHEATYTEEVAQSVGSFPQHSSAKIVAEFAQQTQLPNLVLTHFSPRYQDSLTKLPNIGEIKVEAEKYYQGRLFLANDFDCYQLDLDGKLLLR